MKTAPPIADAEVQVAFERFDGAVRETLLRVRAMIYAEAAELPQIGRLAETLKWGQPAYLTPDRKAATTLRLGAPKTGGAAVFTHCQSSVMAEVQALAGPSVRFEGNRALLLQAGAALPEAALRHLSRRALTYHLPPDGT